MHPEVIHEAQVHQDALELLRKGLNEEEIEEDLGSRIPQEVKEFILKVDMLSRNLLPHENRLLLPSPKDVIKNRQVAHLVFNAAKRRLYGIVCDEASETYQAWITGGLDTLCSKGFVASAVVAVLADIKISIPTVAVGLSALLMRRGITNFCRVNKPKRFMDLRKNRLNKSPGYSN